MPNSDERITTAELHRLFADLRSDLRSALVDVKADHRRMGEQIQVALQELGETRVRMTAAELDINEIRSDAHRCAASVKSIDDKVNDTVKNAAFVSGGIAVLAFILKLWPFGKH